MSVPGYIEPRKLLDQTVSGTTVATSTIHTMKLGSRGALQIVYGAGLNAAFSVQGSVDGVNFQDIGISIAAATGSAGQALIDLSQTGTPYYQVVITPTSGSANVKVWANAKGA